MAYWCPRFRNVPRLRPLIARPPHQRACWAVVRGCARVTSHGPDALAGRRWRPTACQRFSHTCSFLARLVGRPSRCLWAAFSVPARGWVPPLAFRRSFQEARSGSGQGQLRSAPRARRFSRLESAGALANPSPSGEGFALSQLPGRPKSPVVIRGSREKSHKTLRSSLSAGLNDNTCRPSHLPFTVERGVESIASTTLRHRERADSMRTTCFQAFPRSGFLDSRSVI